MLDVGDEAQGQQHGPQVKAQTLGGKSSGVRGTDHKQDNVQNNV